MAELKRGQGDSGQESITEHVSERNLSEEKKVEIYEKLHPEATRNRLIQWGGASFLAMMFLSAGLTSAAALFPNRVDSEPIRDWTHLMVTVHIGLGSGVLGYYFGSQAKPTKKE